MIRRQWRYVRAAAARRAPDATPLAPSRRYMRHCVVCVESLIFSMAQITLFRIFYIFTFYLVERDTIFYQRAKPTTILSLFFYKVQCFIPPVAGGVCYFYVQWGDACVRCVFIRSRYASPGASGPLRQQLATNQRKKVKKKL